MAREGELPLFPTADTHTPQLDYSARVKGGSGHADFSVVVSLFLRRRKTRKIGETVQK
jgi:hypothetical protein